MKKSCNAWVKEIYSGYRKFLWKYMWQFMGSNLVEIKYNISNDGLIDFEVNS